jgi:hypothetical protein
LVVKMRYQSGIMFVLDGAPVEGWRQCAVSCWRREPYVSDGREGFVGYRTMCGTMYCVFKCSDGKLRAVVDAAAVVVA